MLLIKFLMIFTLFMIGVNVIWIIWEICTVISRKKEEDMNDWFL